jgi:hypothetical protein
MVVEHGVGLQVYGNNFILADSMGELFQVGRCVDQVVGLSGGAIHIFFLDPMMYIPYFP